MRFAIFALILAVFSTPAFAAPACEDDPWGLVGLGENFTAIVEAFRTTAGDVNACWTNPKTGASTVLCPEVEAADKAGAFGAHYKYDWDYSISDQANFAQGFINCTPINAKDILENLQLADLAQATENGLGCNLPFLKELADSPRSDRSHRFMQTAFDAYQDGFVDLRKALLERDQLTSQNDRGHSSCQMRGTRESLTVPAACREYIRSGDSTKGRIAVLNEKIQTMEARIPFMADKQIAASVEEAAKRGDRSPRGFARAFYVPLMSMYSEMDKFKNELSACKAGEHYNLTPSLRRRLWQIADYDKLVNTKEKLNPHLKRVLTCMHDHRNAGEGRLTVAVYGASALSMLLSGGASAGVIALGATARAGLVTLDLAVGGVSAIRSADAIYNACYKDKTFSPGGAQCSAEQSFDFVMQRTPAATCARNVVTGAAVLGNMAWSASMMKNTSFGRAPDTSMSTSLIPQKPTSIPFVPKKK